RIADERVAGRQHVDDVARQSRQRVRHRGDYADDAEGGVLLQRDAVLTAEGVGAQELDAGDAIGDHLELFDLRRQAADLRLLEFLAAEFLRAFRTDFADAGDGLAPIVEAAPLERALRRTGRR